MVVRSPVRSPVRPPVRSALRSQAGGAAETLLLDAYPGATAAFAMHKLRAAYSGSCIRVRRSSDNAEQDIGFSGTDLDESALTTFVGANNGFVTTWYDQSGNGNNYTQTTASIQHKIVNAGSVYKAGGRAILTPSSDQERMTTGTLSPAVSQPYTRMGVFSQGSGAAAYALDAPSQRAIIGIRGSDWSIYAGGFVDGGTPDTNRHLRTAIFNGASSNNLVDGASVATGNAGSSNPTSLELNTSTSAKTPVYIQSEIVWNSDQTSNLSGIHSSLADYYGITLP